MKTPVTTSTANFIPIRDEGWGFGRNAMRVLALVKPHVKTFWVSDRPSKGGLGTERKLVANPRTHARALQDFSRALMNSRSRENGKKNKVRLLLLLLQIYRFRISTSDPLE
jgi:hypothetical protein